jgi:hypothetical protein
VGYNFIIPEKERQRMDEQKDAGQTKEKTPKEVPPPVPPPIDPPKSPPNPEPEGNNREGKPKKSSTISDKVMVWATCVIAAGTLVSAGAIFLQWREMIKGGADTTALVGYAQRQADDADKMKLSADKQSSASQQFADTANLINGNINDATGKLNSQATWTQNLATNMQTQADRTKDLADRMKDQAEQTKTIAEQTKLQVSDSEAVQAAQLIVNISPARSPGVFMAGASGNMILINWDIEAKNVGPTIARNVSLFSESFEIVGANGEYIEPPGQPFSKLTSHPSAVGPAIPPNGGSVHFQSGQQLAITSSKSSMVIYMQISYVDVFKHAQFVPVCVYYNWHIEGFTYCPR